MIRASWERFALAACALSLIWLGVVVWSRWLFPWPVEWLEGATLQHVERVVAGRSLYPEPQHDFVPLLYPPLAYFAMALPAWLFGGSLPVLRAASLACLIASVGLIARMASRHAGVRGAGFVAVAWFALGFGYAGAFVDLARVDGVWLCLCLAGAERLQARRWRAALLWLAVSVLAKQHGLFLLAAASLWLVVRTGRAAVPAIAPAWVCLLASLATLQALTDGRFLRYTLAVPHAHGFEAHLLLSYGLVDVCLYLPVMAWACFTALLRRARSRRGLCALDVTLLAALVVSALGRAHPGGFDNVRLPGFAFVCIVGAGELARRLRATRRGPSLGLQLLALVQLGMLAQAPAIHMPGPEARRGFERLQGALSACDGPSGRPVAFDYGPPLSAPALHTMALSDLHMAGGSLATKADAALVAWLKSATRPGVVGLGASFDALTRAVEQHYVLCRSVAAPRMTTGYQPPPVRIYRAR